MTAPARARWFAPGRVNLIGDHTDYQLGWVLPFAIAQGITVTVDVNDTSRLEVRSSVFGSAPAQDLNALEQATNQWWSYVAGAVAHLRAVGVAFGGVHVSIDGDLPPGAGLASSASVTCATAAALIDAVGERVDAAAVAAIAQRVENEFVGAGVGYMDPAAVMLGSTGRALLIDTRTRQTEALPLPTVAEGLTLLLFDSGTGHTTSGTEYAARVHECAEAAKALSLPSLRDVSDAADVERIGDELLRRRARHVATENQRVLDTAQRLREGRARSIGPLLRASHESLRDDFEASTPMLDLIVDEAADAGALGARMTGAGFGGSVVVLVEEEKVEAVTEAVASALAERGIAPTRREVSPASGAAAVPL